MRQYVFLCGGKKASYRDTRSPSDTDWLALAKETAVGEWLPEIVPPRRQIGVRVRSGIPWGSSNIVSQRGE
jgi:hypothetical protein